MDYQDHPAKDSEEFVALVTRFNCIPDGDSSPFSVGHYYGMLQMYLMLNELHLRSKEAPREATHYTTEEEHIIWWRKSKAWSSTRQTHYTMWKRYYSSTSGSKTIYEWKDSQTPNNPIELNIYS